MFRTKYMRQCIPPAQLFFQPAADSSSGSSSCNCRTWVFDMYQPAASGTSAATMEYKALVDDLVKVWWESNWMPVVLTDRATARYFCLLA